MFNCRAVQGAVSSQPSQLITHPPRVWHCGAAQQNLTRPVNHPEASFSGCPPWSDTAAATATQHWPKSSSHIAPTGSHTAATVETTPQTLALCPLAGLAFKLFLVVAGRQQHYLSRGCAVALLVSVLLCGCCSVIDCAVVCCGVAVVLDSQWLPGEEAKPCCHIRRSCFKPPSWLPT